MTELRNRYGDWVLIAGAAVGLGESFSAHLARQGFNLVMIDNQKDELSKLSDKLVQEYKIQVLPLTIDLFEKEAVEFILEKTRHLEIRLLIYNAAFSQIISFKNYTSADLEHYINVNVGTPLKLVHAFSKRLIDRNQKGGILLMSSLSGLLGMQYIVPYAASKAFTWNLAESLHHELKPHEINVMACIAGATATEAYLGTNPRYGFFKPQVQQPEIVAKLALKHLHKKALYIPGYWNRFNYFILTRILPRKMASYFANKTIRKMYAENVAD